MPVSPTYPGVYIDEVPSTVRTITGVATSITAFVGRALRGPTDEPLRISSWGDFERRYGGLWQDSSMSYAVQQYFLNGGVDAVIARLVHTEGAVVNAALPASLGSATGSESWSFQATVAGTAGNTITLTLSNAASAPDDVHLFDVVISDGVNPDDSATDVDVTTLSPGDTLGTHGRVTVEGPIPPIRPDEGVVSLAHGTDATRATATVGGAMFTAATTGEGGNAMVATVSDGSGPGQYDLLIELFDDDGDLLASALYVDVTAGGAWPVATLDGTTDHLVDVTGPAPAPSAAGSAPFVDGFNHEKAHGGAGVTITGLPLVAASEGAWGNSLRAAFDHDVADGLDATHFNLHLREVDSQGREVGRETFRNVSVSQTSSRYVVEVLNEQSSLVRLAKGTYALPPVTPPSSATGDFDWLEFAGGHDGDALDTPDFTGSPGAKTGIYLLEKTDLFNLLVIPPAERGGDTHTDVWTEAMKYCKARRALLLVDAPEGWTTKDQVTTGLDGLSLQGDSATNAALYWPQIKFSDPLREYRLEAFPPGGAVAGLMARMDGQRGVWRAPAGVDASITGARALTAAVTDNEHGQLNPLGVNVIRTFPVIGTVAWGARTIRGADQLASEWKYIPVRRLALYIEESLYRGTQWAVFEGNDERLWAQLRLNIGTFMHNLFRQGAFQGTSPRDAYLVRCDSETTTQSDIDRGIVNVVVGFRPLKPAEFVILKISQLAGQAGA